MHVMLRPARMMVLAGLAAVATSAVVAAVVSARPGGSGPGNAPNAKQCQKGGWENLLSSTGTSFASNGECVRYAAKGGTLFTARSLCDKLLDDAEITVPADARYLLGTPQDDDFSGRLHAGTDVLCGFAGDDVVGALGSGAADVFLGGDGHDSVGVLFSGVFDGGAGNDSVGSMRGGTFNGGGGHDTVEDMQGGTFNQD